MTRISDDDIAGAAGVLRRGGLVVFPTETYYGLATNALDACAVARAVRIKGREEGKPMAVIVPDLEAARRLWRELPAPLEQLAERHWPGPLTLVASGRPGLPSSVLNEHGEVGARVSSHPVASRLAQAFGGPLTASSANRAGGDPPRTMLAARAALGEEVDVYLDGGSTPGGPPSTIVALGRNGTLRVLRQGAIVVAHG